VARRGAACYVHVPFCGAAVPTATSRSSAARGSALRARRRRRAGRARRRARRAGGYAVVRRGTPSALPIDDLARIVAATGAIVGLDADAEISLELNPEDVDAALARSLRAAGFTRASLGIQSFDDDVLTWLGRAHDGARARSAVEACLAAGLRTAVDLIVGVPDERPGRLERDVAAIAASGVGHVSAYLLTVEAGTPLVQLIAKKARAAVDEDQQADAYERVQALLGEHGFAQYEVSSYARPGEESRHNRIYWQGGGYLGVGPSAHSMRPLDDGGVLRRHTTARLDAWLPDPAHAAHEDETLAPRTRFARALRSACATSPRASTSTRSPGATACPRTPRRSAKRSCGRARSSASATGGST